MYYWRSQLPHQKKTWSEHRNIVYICMYEYTCLLFRLNIFGIMSDRQKKFFVMIVRYIKYLCALHIRIYNVPMVDIHFFVSTICYSKITKKKRKKTLIQKLKHTNDIKKYQNGHFASATTFISFNDDISTYLDRDRKGKGWAWVLWGADNPGIWSQRHNSPPAIKELTGDNQINTVHLN